MVRHNNIIPNQHFHKKWARRVKTGFAQPMQKKARRSARAEKAASVAPAPVSGALRPLVQCPTRKVSPCTCSALAFSLQGRQHSRPLSSDGSTLHPHVASLCCAGRLYACTVHFALLAEGPIEKPLWTLVLAGYATTPLP